MQKIWEGISSAMLDTAPIIYFMEEHPVYLKAVEPLFALIDKGECLAFTSVVTLVEVLTKPMEQNNERLQKRYEELLQNSENLFLSPLDKNIAIESARLRAKYGLKTPDAIQLATGCSNRAEAFVTNDDNLKRVKEIKVMVLRDFIESEI